MTNLRKDDLIWGGYHLYQEEGGFCFSFDAVILACFFQTYPHQKVLDAATGNGVLPLLLGAKEPTLSLYGIELNHETALLAQRNMAENHVNASIIQGDTMKALDFLEEASFDAIIANPPYYKKGSVRLPKNPKIAVAKTEIHWDTARFFENAFALLKPKGTLTLSYPIARQQEISAIAKKTKFTENRRLLLQSMTNKPPYLILFEWIKEGQPCRSQECTAIIQEENGTLHPMMKKILEEKSCAN